MRGAVLSDEAHCGACGQMCADEHGEAACVGGSCVPDCAAGWADCDGDPAGSCETDATTLADCGGCGVTCALEGGGESCAGGACVLTGCDAPYEDCDGDDATGCETPLVTTDDCGACGASCTNPNGATVCTGAGACLPSCAGGFGDCDGDPSDGCETSTQTSVAHCGACESACANPHGSAACAGGDCTPTCAPGWGVCDGDPADGCTTPLTTPSDCGACGLVCTLTEAATSCLAGSCSSSVCDPGTADCDDNTANGCEADLASVATCGSCDTACAFVNGANACVGGTCDPTCSPGFGDCDGNPANGCETNTSVSDGNCGACGVTCADVNSANTCSGGACSATCGTGWASCDGNAANGCETSTTTLGDCGGCGVGCDLPNASETCASGTCTLLACGAGWGDCTGAPGCETPLTTTSDCGACGASCTALNGSQACTAGTCVPSCAAGYGSCDGVASNGCETNLSSSDAHCGACGTACADVGGTNACASGTCTPSCAAGSGNCDGNNPNGCETSLTTSDAHCGACSAGCADVHGTSTCLGGACAATCDPGWGNCDLNGANGCETDTSVSDTHCGTCGTTCADLNGTNTCVGGTCAPSCTGGWADCDGLTANGCERSVTTLSDCGTCNTVCSLPYASESCATGSCQVGTCDPGRANCDATASNGCERLLATNANTCATATVMTRASDGAAYIVGDAGLDTTVTYSGFTSRWFRLTATESLPGNTGPSKECLQYLTQLVSPAGMNFDLYLYFNPCGAGPSASATNGPGLTDGLYTGSCDSASDDTFDAWMEVRYVSGNLCGSWSLQVERTTDSCTAVWGCP